MRTLKEKKQSKRVEKVLNSSERRKLLKLLTYEKKNGKPIYYHRYREVLEGRLPLEAVMGSGYLHALILRILFISIFEKLDTKKYEILFGEVGYKYKKGSWYNLDLAIWEREKLKEPSRELITIPPKVVIEIDTKVELEEFENKFGMEYYVAKTQDLLDSGVEKVVWIFTPSKKVLVAEKNKPWIMADWDYTFNLIEDVKINLEDLLREVLKNEPERGEKSKGGSLK